MSEENEMSKEQTPEESFAALRAQKEALEAELLPLKREKIVREAGFDPTSGNGLALQDLLGFDANVDTAKEIAAKYGWEPAKPEVELSANERAAQEFASRQANLNSVSTSDTPTSVAERIADLDLQIQQARAQGLPAQHLVSDRIRLAARTAVAAGPRW